MSDKQTLVTRLNQHALPDPHDEREVMHAPLLREAAERITELEEAVGDIRECDTGAWLQSGNDGKRYELMRALDRLYKVALPPTDK